MIVCSINIRGLGGLVKKRKIRNPVRVERLDFVAIQEIKKENIAEGLCRFLWGTQGLGGVSPHQLGRVAGSSLWDKSSGSLVYSFSGETTFWVFVGES